jgi:PKHD-type hydroxylase
MGHGGSWEECGPTVVEDAVSTSLCQRILAYFARCVPAARSYQGVVNGEQRRCDFVALSEEGILQDVHQMGLEMIGACYPQGIALIEGQVPLIYRYTKGVGFVTHHDEVTAVEVSRAAENGQPVIHGDITATFSLSDPDEYDGGELYFVGHDSEYKLRKGSAVTFPATRQMMHGVRSITRGERFTMLIRFAIDR